MKYVILILVVLISEPLRVFAEEMDSYVYEADYYSLDGEIINFSFTIDDGVLAVYRRLDHFIEFYEICSDVRMYCLDQFVIPNSNDFADTSWQANGGVYTAGKWFEIQILGRKYEVIKISSEGLNSNGIQYASDSYLYNRTLGIIAIETRYSLGNADGTSLLKSYFLHGKKGLGAKKRD